MALVILSEAKAIRARYRRFHQSRDDRPRFPARLLLARNGVFGGWPKRTAANPHTMPNSIAAPDFRWEISLDTGKQRSYTPGRQKQRVINYQ